MFETFSIVASLKPADQQGGFLFAVVTPGDSLISLGLSITAAPALGMQEVGDQTNTKDSKILFDRTNIFQR